MTASSIGCSSSYVPRPGPRVAVIQQGGKPAYVRNGRVYEGGLFGGDLVEAVAGNPEAEEHARAYKSGMLGGFLATLRGGVSTIAGFTFLVAGSNLSESGPAPNSTERTAGTALLLGGIGAYIAGVVIMLNAQPHMWDAINVYNDAIPAGPYLYPYPYPYGYPPPPGAPAPLPSPVAPPPTPSR